MDLIGRAATSGSAAAEQANKPDDGEDHDCDPQKVDQSGRRVEQEPQNEEDYRSDDQ